MNTNLFGHRRTWILVDLFRCLSENFHLNKAQSVFRNFSSVSACLFKKWNCQNKTKSEINAPLITTIKNLKVHRFAIFVKKNWIFFVSVCIDHFYDILGQNERLVFSVTLFYFNSVSKTQVICLPELFSVWFSGHDNKKFIHGLNFDLVRILTLLFQSNF